MNTFNSLKRSNVNKYKSKSNWILAKHYKPKTILDFKHTGVWLENEILTRILCFNSFDIFIIIQDRM